ncbi:uncharacterized protein [Atheta coriaria]|uniref:uncharacterized protein n=1 Tax=Dalotia coriaria TaxID=877792 RepID=UPI0031F34D4F
MIENNPYLSLKNAKVLRGFHANNKLQKFLYVYAAIFIIFAMLMVELQTCNDKSRQYSCGYAFPSYFFINNIEHYQRILYNLYSVSFIAGLSFGLMNTVFMIYCLLIYLDTFYDVFKTNLHQVQSTPISEIRYRKIILAHNQHLYLIKIWITFTKVNGLPTILLFVFGGLITALLFITELIQFDIVSLCHIFLYIIALFSMGWMGERLLAYAGRIRYDTFYACPWDGDVNTVKMLMFMNLNCSHRLCLPLGDYGKCSNALVFSVFKFAYSIVMGYINSIK